VKHCFVFAMAALCLGLNAADPAAAQSYPGQLIKIIVPAAPGGPNDIAARLAAQILQPKLGQPIVTTLNAPINQALRTPEMEETIARLGAVPRTGSPEEFAATIAAYLQKWRALGRAANISID
jgi:tripartite-type tricarboxylate transporter receptor subunit TctC